MHDIGGAVRGQRLDVFMASCGEAVESGRQQRIVRVLRIAAAARRDPGTHPRNPAVRVS